MHGRKVKNRKQSWHMWSVPTRDTEVTRTTADSFYKERHVEVDKLLHKMQIDMHPTVQPGGPSPKPIHNPTSTSQLKSVSDNMQSTNPFTSQANGKKRERSDPGIVSVKRERSLVTDDGNFTQFKPENTLKSDISKITESGGGLVDPEGAEKLVQLMQPDRAEMKMELISRSMLASIIAATEKFDCLGRFVQLKGLSVLDEWLQDAHKGKIGDGSPKDGDKSSEEFLLILLRALDKLPVNLHALQMCNIGKSVNHLRSHKNVEIQRKARGLVDMWKKRVEVEMNVIDTKLEFTHTVSWPSRPRLPEVLHDENRNSGGSTDAVVKSSVTQLSVSKSALVKGNGHKLVVKIPNRGHSPGQSAGGGSVDQPSNMNSRSSSPMLSEKHDHFDHFDQPSNIEEAHHKSGEDAVKSKFDFDSLLKLADVSRAASLSANEPESGKSHGASFSAINALVERCVRSVGDDVRMNLLASVAAGEMPRSDLISPTNSRCKNTHSMVDSSMGDDAKSKLYHENNVDQEQSGSADGAQHPSKQKTSSSIHEHAPAGDGDEYRSSMCDLKTAAEPHLELNERLDAPPSVEVEKNDVTGVSSNASLDMGIKIKNDGNKGFDGGEHTEYTEDTEWTLSPEKVKSMHLERSDEDRVHICVSSTDLPLENVGELNGGKGEEMDPRSNVTPAVRQKSDYGTNSTPSNEDKVIAGQGSAVSDQKIESREANAVSKDVPENCSDGAVPQKGSSALLTTKLEHHIMSRGSEMSGVGAEESTSTAEASNVDTKLKFDLNEGFIADEGKCGDLIKLADPGSSRPVHLNTFPFPVPSVSSSLPASITVASAAKGPFVLCEELLRSKGEVGWKGSAATSAFRPAEPRKGPEMPLGRARTHLPDSTSGRHCRPRLDFDLNVPDERILEDMSYQNSEQETSSMSGHVTNRDLVQNRAISSASFLNSGGLVLDLNLVDETSDIGQYSTRTETPFFPLKSSSTCEFPKSEVRRDFDLNNGPVVDDASAGLFLFSQYRGIMQSQSPVAGLRMNNAEMGSFSPWYQAGNTYPGVGPASTVSSQYPRQYVVSLPDGSSDNCRKWTRQGLDLNAGPGKVDTEGRDETLTLASRQLSVARSQALAEEQEGMYQQVAGGVLKKKEYV